MSEKITTPVSFAENVDSRSFSSSEVFGISGSTLTAREREIAIAAIAARASGEPVEAAKKLLAGIAVLDGRHLPVLVWPKDTTLRQQAAWLANESANYAESAERLDARLRGLNQSEDQNLSSRMSCAQDSSELGPTLPGSASSVPAPHEEDTDSPLQKKPPADLDSSDAC